MCSRNFCAGWIIRFSKRACEVPNLSKTDLEEKSETLWKCSHNLNGALTFQIKNN